MKINAAWHKNHPMPKNPTEYQRAEWHIRHQENCGCRPVPQSVLRYIKKGKRCQRGTRSACDFLKGEEFIVIHFGEIWLKGRNRGDFIKRLYQNIKLALGEEKYERLENARDRFILHLSRGSDKDAIMKKLSLVFGISWFAPVIITTNKIPDILERAAKLYKKGEEVRIEVHRSFKGLGYNSQELVGEFLKSKKKFGFELDKDSEKELIINITKDNAMLIKEKIKGAGGLPVGSSGKAVVLLSGGIDSPVASVFAMKRGLIPIYLHVHAFPDNQKATKSKMKTLVETLRSYYPNSKAYFVPSVMFQAAAMKIPKEYELVLFKRFIYKLAESVAQKEDAEVIATGESLGQVASQTVKNLIATDRGMESLLFRPLIALDKQEIVNEAKRIGTYETSIKKYPDVCSIRARNSSTAVSPAAIEKLYKKCKLDSVVASSLKSSLIMR